MDETELLELLALELRGSSASSRSLAETLGGPQLQPYENEAKEEGEKPWDPLASVSEDEQKAELFESLIQDIRTLNEHLQMHQFGELDEDEVGRLGKNLVRSLDRAGALIERVERRWWWFNRRMGKDYRRRMNSYLGCMKSVFQHQANLASLGEKEGFFAAVDVVKSPAWEKFCNKQELLLDFLLRERDYFWAQSKVRESGRSTRTPEQIARKVLPEPASKIAVGVPARDLKKKIFDKLEEVLLAAGEHESVDRALKSARKTLTKESLSHLKRTIAKALIGYHRLDYPEAARNRLERAHSISNSLIDLLDKILTGS